MLIRMSVIIKKYNKETNSPPTWDTIHAYGRVITRADAQAARQIQVRRVLPQQRVVRHPDAPESLQPLQVHPVKMEAQHGHLIVYVRHPMEEQHSPEQRREQCGRYVRQLELPPKAPPLPFHGAEARQLEHVHRRVRREGAVGECTVQLQWKCRHDVRRETPP